MLFSILYRFQSAQRLKNAPRTIRHRAQGAAIKQLRLVKKQGGKLSIADFLGRTTLTIEQYISQKFGFAATGRTLDELKSELLARKVNAVTVQELGSFIEGIDAYRFGGVWLDEKSRSALIKGSFFLSSIEKNTPRRNRP